MIEYCSSLSECFNSTVRIPVHNYINNHWSLQKHPVLTISPSLCSILQGAVCPTLKWTTPSQCSHCTIRLPTTPDKHIPHCMFTVFARFCSWAVLPMPFDFHFVSEYRTHLVYRIHQRVPFLFIHPFLSFWSIFSHFIHTHTNDLSIKSQLNIIHLQLFWLRDLFNTL